LAQARASPAAGINLDHRYVDRRLVEKARKAGLSIWTWTVDDEERFQELLALGVDSITTNWPERMIPMVQQHRNHHFGEQS
jgi:glycerophosphoryl diester phosphodiesterase